MKLHITGQKSAADAAGNNSKPSHVSKVYWGRQKATTGLIYRNSDKKDTEILPVKVPPVHNLEHGILVSLDTVIDWIVYITLNDTLLISKHTQMSKNKK